MAASTGDGAAWVIPGAAVAIAAIGGALELGGAAASALAGHGARFAPFSMVSAVTLVHHGTTALWPRDVARARRCTGWRSWRSRSSGRSASSPSGRGFADHRLIRRLARSRAGRRPCAHPLSGRAASATASTVPRGPQARRHRDDGRRHPPRQPRARRPGGAVRVVGGRRAGVDGTAVDEDDGAVSAAGVGRARAGHRDGEQVRPVGRTSA